MLIDLEKIKQIDFNSPKIQAEFDKIEQENEEILKGCKTLSCNEFIQKLQSMDFI